MIKTFTLVDPDLHRRLWALYYEAFEPLDAYAVQRHLMFPHEFDTVMGDPRVDKWVAFDGDRPVALAVYTNDLAAWPAVSPAYFERRWPGQFAARKIWYCGFVAVPGHQPGVFTDLITAMYRHVEQQGGVIALDICRYNIEMYGLDRAVKVWLNRISGGQVFCDTDEQSYQLFDTTGAPR